MFIWGQGGTFFASWPTRFRYAIYSSDILNHNGDRVFFHQKSKYIATSIRVNKIRRRLIRRSILVIIFHCLFFSYDEICSSYWYWKNINMCTHQSTLEFLIKVQHFYLILTVFFLSTGPAHLLTFRNFSNLRDYLEQK